MIVVEYHADWFRDRKGIVEVIKSMTTICAIIGKLTTRRIRSPTRDIHHSLMHQPFVARVHALVDLVDDAEGGTGQSLEGHEVEDG